MSPSSSAVPFLNFKTWSALRLEVANKGNVQPGRNGRGNGPLMTTLSSSASMGFLSVHPSRPRAASHNHSGEPHCARLPDTLAKQRPGGQRTLLPVLAGGRHGGGRATRPAGL